jgi:hypothetical protein
MPGRHPETVADRTTRIKRLGITEDQLQALETIWNTRTFGLTADQRTALLAGEGYSPLDTLDAIWHELEEAPAHLYLQHGFTPHQAFLLDTNTQARRNLLAPGNHEWDPDHAHAILGSDIPRGLLVLTLLVAQTPEETEALVGALNLDGVSPETFNPEPTLALVQARFERLQQQVDTCDCA